MKTNLSKVNITKNKSNQIKFIFLSLFLIVLVIILGVGGVSAVGNSPNINSSMFLYLRFNNNISYNENYSFSNVIKDFSFSSNNFSFYNISNNILYNSTYDNINEGSFIFNGSSKILINHSVTTTQLNISFNFTSEYWVKRLDFTNYHYIYSNVKYGAGYSSAIWNNGAVRCSFSGLNITNVETSQYIINDSNWHFVACRYFHNGTNASISVFFDGILHNQKNTSGTINNSKRVMILGGDVDGNFALNGSINDLIFFNLSLSDNQILSDYGYYNDCYNNPFNGCSIINSPSIWNYTSLIYTYNMNIYNNLTFINSIVNFSNNKNINLYNAYFNIFNSSINFVENNILQSVSNYMSNFNFSNSIVKGYTTSNNVNYIKINLNSSNFSCFNTKFNNLNYFFFYGSNNFNSSLNINNCSFNNFNETFGFIDNLTGYNYIINSLFENESGNNSYEGLRLKYSNNFLFDNDIFNSTSFNSANLVISYNCNNITIRNSKFRKADGVCIAVRDNAQYVYIINNTAYMCDDYAYDILQGADNIFVYNNTAFYSKHSIAFSVGGSAGYHVNYTSGNNRIYHDRGYGLTFNTAHNGFSFNDYIFNASIRCLSIVSNASEIFVYNITCDNNPNYSFFLGSYINNVTIKDSIIINANKSIYISGTFNVTLWNINLINDSSLIYIRNANTVNITNLSGLYNALYFYSNLSSNLISGSYNFFNVSNLTILNNFNLSELNPRDGSPIWISSSNNLEKHIASNLTDSINVTVSINVLSCDSLSKIQYKRNQSLVYEEVSGTCLDNILTINTLQVDPSQESNEIILTYGKAVIDTCNGFFDAGLSFTSFLIILIIVSVGGFIIFIFLNESNPDFDLTSIALIIGVASCVMAIGMYIIGSMGGC